MLSHERSSLENTYGVVHESVSQLVCKHHSDLVVVLSNSQQSCVDKYFASLQKFCNFKSRRSFKNIRKL